MIEKGFKPTYLKSIHSQLSAVMNYAVNFYDLRSNPCKKAGAMGKCNADERPFWTLDEYNLFLDTVLDKYEAWMGFQILFWTGMRIGELLALRVEDIDFENKTIRIDESYTRLNQKDIYSTPKTEKSVRVITIHDELCDEIKEYISHIDSLRKQIVSLKNEMKGFTDFLLEYSLIDIFKEFIRPKTLKEKLEISKQKSSKLEQQKQKLTAITDKKHDIAI